MVLNVEHAATRLARGDRLVVGMLGQWACPDAFPKRVANMALRLGRVLFFFFFQAEDGIRDLTVTGVQTCALPISSATAATSPGSASCSRNKRKESGA